MINIQTLVRFLLYGCSKKLRPYEKACMDAWEQNLSPRAFEIFKRQLELYDFIQRLSKGKLVLFGSLKGRYYYQSWPKEVFFPMQREDVNVAQIFLSIKEKTKSTNIRADICIHKGRFFSIEFNRLPNFSKTAEVRVAHIWLLADPMVSETEKDGVQGAQKAEPKICGWLHEWKEKRQIITNLKFPLSLLEHKEAIARIHSALPDDYLELISQTEGCKIDNCIVAGLSEVQKIIRPDANFYILAEIENCGVIAIKEEQTDGKLYYIDNENEVPRLLGQSFREAVKTTLFTRPHPD